MKNSVISAMIVLFFGLIDGNDRYGYMTWEWKRGIRSYLHPMVFAFLYKLLQVTGLDTPYIMVSFWNFLVLLEALPGYFDFELSFLQNLI